MHKSKLWVSEAFRNEQVTLDGETRSVTEWCSIKGVAVELVYSRRKRFTSWKDSFRPPTKLKDNPYTKNHSVAAKDALALREQKLKEKAGA